MHRFDPSPLTRRIALTLAMLLFVAANITAAALSRADAAEPTVTEQRASRVHLGDTRRDVRKRLGRGTFVFKGAQYLTRFYGWDDGPENPGYLRVVFARSGGPWIAVETEWVHG